MRSSNLLMLLAVVLLSCLAGGAEAFDLHDIRLLRDSGYRWCRKCDLREVQLQGANLIGAQLQNANLSGAQLQNANLSGAQLQNAHLYRVGLQDADLTSAQLQNAVLSGARLQNADLGGAQLQNARLRSAQLQNAYLRSAQLQKADLHRARLQDADLWGAELQNANLLGAQLQNAHLTDAQLQNADLTDAQLQNAILTGAQLQDANLIRAQLQGSVLSDAQLQNAYLGGAQLQKAFLFRAQLQNVSLLGAQLDGAYLGRANIEGATLAYANLANAVYEPTSQPPDGYIVGIQGLHAVRVVEDISGLVQLRELLQKAGHRDLEREATFSIERAKTRHALDRWTESPLGAAEAVARLIFFEWPVAYGLDPWRALQILLGLMLLLSFAYLPWIGRTGESQRSRGAIYQIWPNERLIDDGDGIRLATYGDIPERQRAHRLKAKTLMGLYGYALYFSLLSAFHIGWRELNVGTWLARLQRQEYTLRALGWPRVISGLQSLISVYLVAIWALTYFGRPFQ